jgi:biopolymer transport protein ExbD
MRRHSRRKQSPEIHLGFQIAPMVDVVFVIMLFFMVLAGQVQVENAHNTKLPGTVQVENSDTPMPDEIAIRIEEDGQVYLNDEPNDTPQIKELPELTTTLKQLKASSVASRSEVLITIYANEQAKYDRVIDVLDALTQAKIANVTFQAGAPE